MGRFPARQSVRRPDAMDTLETLTQTPNLCHDHFGPTPGFRTLHKDYQSPIQVLEQEELKTDNPYFKEAGRECLKCP